MLKNKVILLIFLPVLRSNVSCTSELKCSFLSWNLGYKPWLNSFFFPFQEDTLQPKQKLGWPAWAGQPLLLKEDPDGRIKAWIVLWCLIHNQPPPTPPSSLHCFLYPLLTCSVLQMPSLLAKWDLELQHGTALLTAPSAESLSASDGIVWS